MKTHADVKLWLTEDVEINVSAQGSIAWADVTGNVTIHGLSTSKTMNDLDILEAFFQKGLSAVQEARQGRLFADLVHGGEA